MSSEVNKPNELPQILLDSASYVAEVLDQLFEIDFSILERHLTAEQLYWSGISAACIRKCRRDFYIS